MKVIGAGLPRTATLTQRAALEMLGFNPCYHMNNVFADMDAVYRWRDVLDGTGDINAILSGFEAAVDWPASYYYKELMELYPDAKVLLSVRSGESWARSMDATIAGLFYAKVPMRYLSEARMLVDPLWKAYIEMMIEMWHNAKLLNGEQTTPEFMAQASEAFNQEVIDFVPAEQLLVWNPKDGWEPLCEFLGVPVPGEPLPNINDTESLQKRLSAGCIQVVAEKMGLEL